MGSGSSLRRWGRGRNGEAAPAPPPAAAAESKKKWRDSPMERRDFR